MGTCALHRKTNLLIHQPKLANADVAIFLDDRQPPNEFQVVGLQTNAERASAQDLADVAFLELNCAFELWGWLTVGLHV